MERLDLDYIASLVLGAQYGSSDSFAELYAATHQKVYRFAYRYLRDETTAENMVQETYTAALKRIGELRDPQLFLSWLNQIEFRICFERKKEQECVSESNTAPGQTLDESSRLRPEILVEIDGRRYLVERIMGLPSTESQVLILYYYDHLKTREIARMMEISERAVKRYLESGRTRLSLLTGQ